MIKHLILFILAISFCKADSQSFRILSEGEDSSKASINLNDFKTAAGLDTPKKPEIVSIQGSSDNQTLQALFVIGAIGLIILLACYFMKSNANEDHKEKLEKLLKYRENANGGNGNFNQNAQFPNQFSGNVNFNQNFQGQNAGFGVQYPNPFTGNANNVYQNAQYPNQFYGNANYYNQNAQGQNGFAGNGGLNYAQAQNQFPGNANNANPNVQLQNPSTENPKSVDQNSQPSNLPKENTIPVTNNNQPTDAQQSQIPAQ